MNQEDAPRGYPNVRARLRLSRMGPGLPKREIYMDIWMKGSMFRVRDEAGRDMAEILEDITAKRGLGAAARTMEGIMDIWSVTLDEGEATRGATELFGDMATDEGWVYPRGKARWAIAAERVAPAAEQILSKGRETQLEPLRDVTRFGKTCTEYHGFVEVEDQGVQHRNEITRVISPPFVLFDQVRNAQDSEHYYIREVVSLEEGAVTDADVAPP